MVQTFFKQALLLTATAVTIVASTSSAYAQTAETYPNRPVTIVVPFPPGGGTDVGARLIAQKLSAKWGQSVVIENKGGAAGAIGVDFVARAKPDGYTLLVGNVGTQSVNPVLYKNLPYNPNTAFAPIGMIAELPLVVLITPTLPYKTVSDVIATAKARPGYITYASSGSGGAPHLAAEILQAASGTKWLHVPYKGGGPAATDVMAGHVNMYLGTVLESIGHIKSGKARGLGVTSAQRSPALPELPTVAESVGGALTGYDTGSWIGMLAPADVPAAILDKVSADLREVLGQADTRQTLINQGATPLPMTRSAFKARIDADRQRYAKIITDANIKVD